MERFGFNKLRLSENLLYVLLWAAIFLVPLLNASMTALSDLQLYEIAEAWCKTLPFFLLFLVNNNIFIGQFLLKKRYLQFVAVNLLIISIVFLGVDYAQTHITPLFGDIFPKFEQSPYSTKMVMGEVSLTDLSIYWNTTCALFMAGANAGIHLIYRSIQDEQEMGELKRHNLEVEMDYLKYQINPHFFMNTLNNIHALIDIDPKSAQSTVLELSKMMRYVLYESGSESVSLRKDMQFLRNYIELMRIRYDRDIFVNLSHSENLPVDSAIPPLLLIVFIENAFKHGCFDGENSFIDINMEYIEQDCALSCTIVNSAAARTKEAEKGGGIGLFNVRRRLQLLYGNRFSLSTILLDRRYVVRLLIPLKI